MEKRYDTSKVITVGAESRRTGRSQPIVPTQDPSSLPDEGERIK